MLNFSNHACIYCGEPFEEARPRTKEHLVPRARGGSDDPKNIAYSCAECNQEKGTMTHAEYLAHKQGKQIFEEQHPVSKKEMNDPVEAIVAQALDDAGIEWVGENHPHANRLDFYLPQFETHIEVKQFHTDRSAGQLKRSENIIFIVGKSAAQAFADMLKKEG